MSTESHTTFNSLRERIRRVLARFREGPGSTEAPEAAQQAAESGLDAGAFESITGFPVGELGYYVKAMTHRSLLRGRPGSALASNERLEYLGDAVLGFVTADHLFRLYPGEDEGFLTRLRAKLVNGKALAECARTIGLDHLIMVSQNLRQQAQTKMFASVMADAFEALIGALFLDRGMDSARGFIERVLLAPLDFDKLMQLEDNPKSLLLEFAQARGWPQPAYRVQSATGPSHERHFVVEVLVRGEPHGSGEAGSKKQAEQFAAANALRVLRDAESEPSTGHNSSLSTESEQVVRVPGADAGV